MNKKVLFLTNLLPFPSNSGGTIATRRNLDVFYKNGYELTLLFFSNNSNFSDIELFKQNYPKINLWFINNNNNVRSIKNLLLSFFKSLPLNIYRNYNKEFYNKVIDLFTKNSFDLLYCDHLEMFQYVPVTYQKKTILYEHNAEYMIWMRYAKRLKNPIIKIPVFLEALRYKRYELNKCEKAGITLAAPNDLVILSKKTKHRNSYQETYHLGDDSLLKLPPLTKKEGQIHILFIGTMTWQANIDGVNWFEKSILPLLTKDYPDLIFDVVGKLKDSSIIETNSNPNLIYHGFVESTEPYFQQSTVFVCPLRFGSGMKVKNIEALYRGIPLVTTTIGAESIDLQNGTNSFITDEPEQFASYIKQLIKDSDLWNNISKNARQLASNKYTKEKAEKKLLEQINEIINN